MINVFVLKTTLKAYLALITLLGVILYNDLTLLIVLQNTVIFLIISILIFYIFNYFKENIFAYASFITYLRIVISIILLSISFNALTDQNIFNKFYLEDYFAILALIALCLDGIDGYLARRFNEQCNFGEVFDQDADTLLILTLCTSLYLNKDTSVIVFLIPFYRYIFLVFMMKYKWMKRKLPRSYYRKLSCVLSTFILIFCHSQYVKDTLLVFFVMISLFVITFSFAKDILWLYMRKEDEYI
ncbi:MAG: CDP-alcohol phosphatidyltransferase family protein [Gammaproteobacteria bacterium]|jgi:phosphatidylglycerophosphate synthase|nr:CDP-alcohol phosphatidyltransferase family protein [Gammaproteobacteria bacterium]MBT4462622.1 CDP-alcohol phosphatidyltransferase family protein [Gammaproteobacteria bacterium]MBT4654869.1 CDP-alcohol phosphatidyltransferase family protein [Gammaproteobacteria bacterium]MBT5116631.1 CDP-alcohol phosphatidyltransferase family protein [Gammaproteobacteria bacterium]MBT5761742.1 CDP-alcohol phosphatidyltransferase family protein [Gammaproteobacteria bacterium]